jgi:hypothetical protein
VRYIYIALRLMTVSSARGYQETYSSSALLLNSVEKGTIGVMVICSWMAHSSNVEADGSFDKKVFIIIIEILPLSGLQQTVEQAMIVRKTG